MKARVSQLHKTEADWNKLPDFIPIEGEFIIFDPDEQHSYARLKVGDGRAKLKNLPFFVDSTIDRHFNGIIDAGRITEYKN